MFPKITITLAFILVTLVFGLLPWASAQESTAKTLETGTFHGKGDQNYDLPDSADLSKYDAVVIYCERFQAVFGVAKLEKF